MARMHGGGLGGARTSPSAFRSILSQAEPQLNCAPSPTEVRTSEEVGHRRTTFSFDVSSTESSDVEPELIAGIDVKECEVATSARVVNLPRRSVAQSVHVTRLPVPQRALPVNIVAGAVNHSELGPKRLQKQFGPFAQKRLKFASRDTRYVVSRLPVIVTVGLKQEDA